MSSSTNGSALSSSTLAPRRSSTTNACLQRSVARWNTAVPKCYLATGSPSELIFTTVILLLLPLLLFLLANSFKVTAEPFANVAALLSVHHVPFLYCKASSISTETFTVIYCTSLQITQKLYNFTVLWWRNKFFTKVDTEILAFPPSQSVDKAGKMI